MPLILLLVGCDNPADDLSQSWQIDRLRVLAVAAEPAEPQPGDTVTFTSLVVSPVVPVALTTWFACLPTEADSYGCTLDPAVTDALTSTDPSTLTPEEQAKLFAQLQAAGLIGVEPYYAPTWTVPTTALDGLDDAAKVEGLSAIVSVTAIPEGDEVDEADLELAYKRVPVSLATTPNHNPVVASTLFDGAEVVAGAPIVVSPDSTHTVELVLTDESIETYEYVNDEGAVEERTEEPYLAWYTEGGSFDATNTLWPTLSTTWTAPGSGDVSLWSVVRDRRGGMAWAGLDVQVQ